MAAQHGTSLKIVPQPQKELSREAKRFNVLTEKIGKLERAIEADKAKYEKILTTYMDEMQPLKVKHAEAMLTVAKLLDQFPNRKKLGKRQRESVQDMIVDLCDRAFSTIEPSPEQKAIYDKWSDITYDAAVEAQEAEGKIFVEQMLKQEMGIDIDMTDIDQSPEGFARFQEQMRAELEKLPEGRPEPGAGAGRRNQRGSEGARARTTDFMRAEKRRIADEELKNKSLRTLYITLAKVLHPDTEIDPVVKLEKEEAMKRVTSAYAEKNFTALLQLEMEWVHKESLRSDSLTQATLKLYIAALQDQVEDLKHEQALLLHHPRFHPILEFAHLPIGHALGALRAAAKNERLAIAEFNDFKRMLAVGTHYMTILHSIDGYLDAYVYNDPFNDDRFDDDLADFLSDLKL